MGVNKRTTSNAIWLSVINGEFKQSSTEDNPEAVARKYEDKDGNEKVKYEIPYSSVDGVITNIEFKDSDFGESAHITLSDGEIDVKVTLGTGSRYFSDFAKKLPNLDLNKEVVLTPYEMENDKGKLRKGISIKQDGEKVPSYYWDAKKKKSINGIPVVSEEDSADYDSDDWKMHFIKEKKFLKKSILAMEFGAATASQPAPKPNTRPTAPADNEPDDLPF